MKEEIVKRGLELGFCKIGFTHAKPFIEYENLLKKHLNTGNYPPFVTEDINLRTNPQLILPGCKTIISVAMSYKNNVNMALKNPPQKGQGFISASAWGVDYHILLKQGMEKLIEYVNTKTNHQFIFQGFVDTGHLSDREIARRAGIGYIGKNSNLITHCNGSFVWLGHILTNMELEPDMEVENQCGDCSICLNACPTNAINEDGTIDYSKCLANILIQKGELSQQVIEKMGKRVYGCDTCQAVCPKNKAVLNDKTNNTETEIGWIDLDELAGMSNKEFKEKYGHRAFSWRGKKVLQRNIDALRQKN